MDLEMDLEEGTASDGVEMNSDDFPVT